MQRHLSTHPCIILRHNTGYLVEEIKHVEINVGGAPTCSHLGLTRLTPSVRALCGGARLSTIQGNVCQLDPVPIATI